MRKHRKIGGIALVVAATALSGCQLLQRDDVLKDRKTLVWFGYASTSGKDYGSIGDDGTAGGGGSGGDWLDLDDILPPGTGGDGAPPEAEPPAPPAELDLGAAAEAAGFLWKPVSESDGNLVLLLPPALQGYVQDVVIVGEGGVVQADDLRDTGPYEDGRPIWRADRPGAAFDSPAEVQVFTSRGRIHWLIPNAAVRTENIDGDAFPEGGGGSDPSPAAARRIDTGHGGRPTIGDLDADGWPDLVLFDRDRASAWRTDGERIWDVPVSVNYTYEPHRYWDATSIGWVEPGSLWHLEADWLTVVRRDGRTGEVRASRRVDGGPWMYVVALERTSGEKVVALVGPSGRYAHTVEAPRVVWLDPATLEERGRWGTPAGAAPNFSYAPPAVGDFDGDGAEELCVQGVVVAPGEAPEELFPRSPAFSDLIPVDLVPNRRGLELVAGEYNGLGLRAAAPGWEGWRAELGVQPHESAVGDFHDRRGTEILSRNADGVNHVLTGSSGDILTTSWRAGLGWARGEYVQGIEWTSAVEGTEVLCVQRHASRPVAAIVDPRTGAVVGGPFRDLGEPGPIEVGGNPWEAIGWAVDLIGDGQEELLRWAPPGTEGGFWLYQGAAPGSHPRRWTDRSYRAQKKITCWLYSPR